MCAGGATHRHMSYVKKVLRNGVSQVHEAREDFLAEIFLPENDRERRILCSLFATLWGFEFWPS